MKRVLLVVPSPEVSRLLHDRLHSKGCSVVTAPNLSGARLHIESLGPLDWVICSEVQEDGSGLAFLTDLRASETTAGMKRMLLSPDDAASDSLRSGAWAIRAEFMIESPDFISSTVSYIT